MKIVSKKLLSMVLTVCLLATIALPAGILSASADPVADPSTIPVTEYYFDRSTVNSSAPVVLNASDYAAEAGAEITISFDYYVKHAPSKLYIYDMNHPNDMMVGDAQAYFDSTVSGIGHYEHTYTTTGGALRFRLHDSQTYDYGGVLYVWNCSIKAGDDELTPTATSVGKVDYVVAGGMLDDYNWYGAASAEKTTVTEYTFGTSQTILSSCTYRVAGGATVVISFDYYLPNAASDLYIYDTQNRNVKINDDSEDNLTGSGISHYEATFTAQATSTNTAIFRLHAAVKDFGGVVYIWNFSIKENGIEMTPNQRNYGTTSLVTSGNKLSTYAWYQASTTTSTTASSTSSTESSSSATESSTSATESSSSATESSSSATQSSTSATESTSATTQPTTPVFDASQTPVTEYTFGSAAQTILNVETYNVGYNRRVIVSFDYYVTSKSTGAAATPANMFLYDANGIYSTYPINTETGEALNSGKKGMITGTGISHYEETWSTPSNKSGFNMRLYGNNGDTDKRVYVWNYSIRYADTGVELAGAERAENGTAGVTAGYVVTGKMLSEYSWYSDNFDNNGNPLPTSSSSSATESSTSATESSSSATQSSSSATESTSATTQPTDSNEAVVVNKINLSKFDASKWSADSTLTMGTYGVFCYENEYSCLYPTPENSVSKLSFDYYLPGEVGAVVWTPHPNTKLTNAKTGSEVLEPGVGSFEVTRTDHTSVWRWAIAFVKHKGAPAPTTIPDIYIWNVKMEYNGTTVTTPTVASARTDTVLGSSIKNATAADMVEVMTLADIEDMIAADNEYVTELDFSNCTPTENAKDYAANLYTGWASQVEGSFTLTFDYYLPDEGTMTYVRAGKNNTSIVNELTGQVWLEQGRGQFKATGIELGSSESTYYMFVQRGNATMGKLQVWNVSLVRENDTENKTNMLAGGYWSVPTAEGNNTTVTKKVMLASELPTNPTSATQSTSPSNSSQSSSATQSTQPIAPGTKVVNKINLSKFPANSFNATSVATGDPGGVFSYEDAYSLMPAGKDVTISFDYYLPLGVDVAIRASGSQTLMDTASKSYILATGKSSFSATANFDSAWRWRISFMKNAGAPEPAVIPDMYIWNLEISYDGDVQITTPTVSSAHASCVLAASGLAATEIVEVLPYDNVSAVLNADVEYLTEIDFSANTPTEDRVDYTVEFYTGINAMDNGGSYTLTFDYYLPDSGTNTYVRMNNSSRANQYPGSESAQGTVWLLQGRHKYQYSGLNISNYQSASFYITQRGNMTMGKFYIWNIALTPENNETNNTSLATGSYYEVTEREGNNAVVTTSTVPTSELPDDQGGNTPGGDTPGGDTPGGDTGIDPDTLPIDKRVYLFNFDDYNWEENDYNIAVNLWAQISFGKNSPYTLKEGDVLKLSFNYRVLENADGQGTTLFYNAGDRWGSNAQNPGTSFSNDPEDNTTYFSYEEPNGEFVFEWTVSENDIKKQNFAPCWHQNMNYGTHKFYMWNLKLTVNGSEDNYLTDDTFKWMSGAEAVAKYLEVLAIDPSEIPTVDPDVEVIEPDFDIDIDIPGIDDPTIDDPTIDDPTIDDPTVDDPTVDDPSVDDPTVDELVYITDVYTNVDLGYNGNEISLPEGTYLSVYPFAEGELYSSILAQIGDFPYVAYDIALFHEYEVVNPNGSVTLKIPVPAGFDASLVKLYMTDAYGDMYLVESEVIDGKLVFTTKVLGICIIVNGDLGIAARPDDSIDDPSIDDPSIDDPSIDSPIVLPESPSTGDSVVGIVIAALALAAAAAAMLASKKRTA